ncbi:hypothetical protein [uncultured Agrobacterium sp.]|uniref:hypothetical protein n=1 Tax=uncultured Agrobacterium sp. TaxID=157277 RepID=UPI0025EAA5E9|nr:hypothetical protein [uncultured Agrobacterium sp.]
MAATMQTQRELRLYDDPFRVSICMGGFFFGWVAAHFTLAAMIDKHDGSGPSMAFETSIAIILSALSVIITVLAIIIAIVGTFGFNTLRRAAFDAGMKHAVAQMAEGGEMRNILLARVDELAANAGFKPRSDSDWGNSEAEYGE